MFTPREPTGSGKKPHFLKHGSEIRIRGGDGRPANARSRP